MSFFYPFFWSGLNNNFYMMFRRSGRQQHRPSLICKTQVDQARNQRLHAYTSIHALLHWFWPAFLVDKASNCGMLHVVVGRHGGQIPPPHPPRPERILICTCRSIPKGLRVLLLRPYLRVQTIIHICARSVSLQTSQRFLPACVPRRPKKRAPTYTGGKTPITPSSRRTARAE